jgi:hypothetical protein
VLLLLLLLEGGGGAVIVAVGAVGAEVDVPVAVAGAEGRTPGTSLRY